MTFGRPARTYRGPTVEPSKVGPGIPDFPAGKSGFSVPKSSWYKSLNGSRNPEIKFHRPKYQESGNIKWKRPNAGSRINFFDTLP